MMNKNIEKKIEDMFIKIMAMKRQPIYDAIVFEREFQMKWDNKKREWCKYGVD